LNKWLFWLPAEAILNRLMLNLADPFICNKLIE